MSQVHSAQAAIREKISETSSINYKSNKVAFSVNNKVYRVMLAIRYDPTSPVEDTSCASCQLSCNLLAINIVCLSPVEINKLRRVRGNFSYFFAQMLRFYVTFVVVLASSAALGNGICYSQSVCLCHNIDIDIESSICVRRRCLPFRENSVST